MNTKTTHTEVYTLPEFWAVALINDDFTGVNDKEEKEIRNFQHKNGYCVGCTEEPFFAWRNDANTLGANCLEYTFRK